MVVERTAALRVPCRVAFSGPAVARSWDGGRVMDGGRFAGAVVERSGGAAQSKGIETSWYTRDHERFRSERFISTLMIGFGVRWKCTLMKSGAAQGFNIFNCHQKHTPGIIRAELDSLATSLFSQTPMPEQIMDFCLASASMAVGYHTHVHYLSLASTEIRIPEFLVHAFP